MNLEATLFGEIDCIGDNCWGSWKRWLYLCSNGWIAEEAEEKSRKEVKCNFCICKW